jgi:hypothetical protein
LGAFNLPNAAFAPFRSPVRSGVAELVEAAFELGDP